MVECKVKRTCEVTLVMDQDEAEWIRTLLLYVKGGHPCRNRLIDALTSEGIGLHPESEDIKGEVDWPLPFAF